MEYINRYKEFQKSNESKKNFFLLMQEDKTDVLEPSSTTQQKVYTREQAVAATREYFTGDDLAGTVWVNKYALKDSKDNIFELTPDDMHWRLASEFARIEAKYANPLSATQIYNLIKRFKHIVPQGSPMAGIGNTTQIMSISNCFVVGNPEGEGDSYGAILRIDERIAQLQKRRCGVGADISDIRPAGTKVNNAAITSTGVVPFMERYSNTTREVAQDGRRGALMLSISIRHPEAEKFIDAKMDSTKVTGANVSVKIHDDFMEAVIAETNYRQQWPITGIPKMETYTDAKRIWDKIIFNAHRSAEPGVLFWDQIIRESPADIYKAFGFNTISTNPCISGDTLIAVADGRNAVSIKQLTEEGKEVLVYSTNTKTGQVQIKTGRNPRLTKKNAEVWKVVLDDGSTIIATPDHRFLTKDLQYVQLKDLKPGQSLSPFNTFNNNKYRQICNTGADMIGGAKRNRRQYRLIHEFYNGIVDAKKFDIHHADFNSFNDSINNLEVMTHEDHTRLHSDRMMGDKNPYHKQSPEWKQKFASHPGESNGRFINVSNDALIEHGRKLYDAGNLTKRKWYAYAQEHKLPVSVVTSYRFESFSQFKSVVIGNHKVISAEYFGTQDVYNITVDDNHNYNIITSGDDNYINSSGVCLKNCGELPLPSGDSCRLLSLNLYSYVENPFTSSAYFNWKLFKEHVQIAQRLMDDIVDLELEKIDAIIAKVKSDPESENIKRNELEMWEEIKYKCESGRRTGTGITAEGDMLAALGLKYGTPEATTFSVEVHKTLAIEAYISSTILAEERGAFPIYDEELEIGHPFLDRLKEASPELKSRMSRFGRRNIALLTIAPTGTVSLMTQTTSGIEPAFMVAYTRRKKVNPNDKNVRVDFIDEVGDSWEEYSVFHHHFKTWLQVNGYDVEAVEKMKPSELEVIISQSPYYGAMSNDVNWVEKVRMQGEIQKWIDHSISVTVNLPNDVTTDLVDQVYRTAWKSGCKGCTIYRDGSRSGVLVSTVEEKDESLKDDIKEELFKESHAPKRPKYIDCDVHHFMNKGDWWVGFVGLIDGRPYEVFTGPNSVLQLPKNIESGKIRKTKQPEVNSYDFLYTDGVDNEIIGLNSVFDRSTHDVSKTFSAILRHGMPLPYVITLIESLHLDGDLINTWKNGFKRMIKKYVPDGTVIKSSRPATCPQSEEDAQCNLVYQEGCLICTTCGNSKCS